ncbi:MAG TPA: hypothetical protein VGF30_15590 [Bacteroidia bacterium]
METTPSKNLKKRFYAAIALVSVIFAITILSAPDSLENMSRETLIIKDAPVFLKQRNGNSHDYKIHINSDKFQTPLEITGADLEFTDRKGLQNELRKGDTVEIKYHHTFIVQLTKKGKTYMAPEKAFKSGESMEKWVFWVCLVSLIICITGLVLTISGVKRLGWVTTIVVIIVAGVLFFVFDVHFSNTIEYTEFS